MGTLTAVQLLAAHVDPEPERDQRLLSSVADAGIDVVRLTRPVHPEWYDAADELGLLVVHDLDPAMTHAERRRLTAHRSVVAWIEPHPRRRSRVRRPVTPLDGLPILPVPRPRRRPSDDVAFRERLRRSRRRVPILELPGWPSPSVGSVGSVGDPGGPGDPDVRAAQAHQAVITQLGIEAARAHQAADIVLIGTVWDGRTGTSPSLVGADGAPKPVVDSIAAACRAVLPIADPLPPHLHGHEALALDLRIVNGRASQLAPGATLTAVLSWADGEQRFVHRAAADADSVRRIDTLQVVVPPVDGPLDLDLHLDGDGERVSNSYRSRIFADPHDH